MYIKVFIVSIVESSNLQFEFNFRKKKFLSFKTNLDVIKFIIFYFKMKHNKRLAHLNNKIFS